jgi:cytochrome b561
VDFAPSMAGMTHLAMLIATLYLSLTGLAVSIVTGYGFDFNYFYMLLLLTS